MNEKNGIPLLLERAMARADEAARRVAASSGRLRGEQAKLELLLQHQSTYGAQFVECARGGMDPAALANFRIFLDKLGAAVEWQRRVLADCARSASEDRTQWERERRTTRSFEALLARQRDARMRSERRRAQREHDEIARRRRGAHGVMAEEPLP